MANTVTVWPLLMVPHSAYQPVGVSPASAKSVVEYASRGTDASRPEPGDVSVVLAPPPTALAGLTHDTPAASSPLPPVAATTVTFAVPEGP